MNNGYITTVAVGQSKRLYSGVGIFIINWYYPSSSPQILRRPRYHLEIGGLVCNGHSPTDTSARSGETVIFRLWWPLVKASGYIVVWESLAGIIPVRLLRSCVSRWSTSNRRDWYSYIRTLPLRLGNKSLGLWLGLGRSLPVFTYFKFKLQVPKRSQV